MLTGHHVFARAAWENTSQTFRHFAAAAFSANNASSAPRRCTLSLNIRDCAVLIRNMTHGFKANFSPDGSSACFFPAKVVRVTELDPACCRWNPDNCLNESDSPTLARLVWQTRFIEQVPGEARVHKWHIFGSCFTEVSKFFFSFFF